MKKTKQTKKTKQNKDTLKSRAYLFSMSVSVEPRSVGMRVACPVISYP